MNLSQLKRKLEQSLFFGKTFEEIKKIASTWNLKLTDEEIINNRILIHKVIESYVKCGDDKKLCQNLDDHYQLKKNKDNQFLLIKVNCPKSRNYTSIGEEVINTKIKKLLHNNAYSFNYSDIKKTLQQSKYSWVGGDSTELNNKYIKFDQQSEEEKVTEEIRCKCFHYILWNKTVGVFKSNEIKEICLEKAFDFNIKNDKDKSEYNSVPEPYRKISNIDLLIITNFGLEAENGKKVYILDLLGELIAKRENNRKITQIYTTMEWTAIIRDLLKKKEDDTSINNLKTKELEKQLKRLFH